MNRNFILSGVAADLLGSRSHRLLRRIASAGRRLTLIGLLGLPVATGCQSEAPTPLASESSQPAPPPTVEATVVQQKQWPRRVTVQGALISDEESVVGSRGAGRVQDVLVDIGQFVRRGEPLMKLDPVEFDLRVQQAEGQLLQARARLGLKPDESDSRLNRLKAPPVVQEEALRNEARTSYERTRKLAEQGIVSREELQLKLAALEVAEARYSAALNSVDEQIAQLEVLRTQLAIARQAQADAVITAPFDGAVQARHVAPGGYVQIGHPIVTLVRNDPLRFRGGVPERQAGPIALGLEAEIFIAGSDRPILAHISRIEPGLERSSRVLFVEIDVPNPNFSLRSGVFAEAEIEVEPQATALAVPDSAVFDFAGIHKVWRIENGQAREQRVHTGRRLPGWVEIVDGLHPGDQVASKARMAASGPVKLVPSDDHVGLSE